MNDVTPSSTKSEKILIIESNATFASSVAEALRKDGYTNVFISSNGEEGLKNIYDLLPHLVLLNVNLPIIDGYTVLTKKQAEPLLAKIPVFLLSTQGMPLNTRMVPANSVSEFIVALDSNPSIVLQKVNKIFNHSEAPAANAVIKSEGKKKILWVEDDKLIGMILARKLISSGMDLIHAKDGNEAMEALKTVTPDAIVVDILLPGMSGFDILQNVYMQEKLKGIPTMVLSNLSKPSDIEKAKMLGAKKFLVKAATSIDQIVAEIRDLCD